MRLLVLIEIEYRMPEEKETNSICGIFHLIGERSSWKRCQRVKSLVRKPQSDTKVDKKDRYKEESCLEVSEAGRRHGE